jgi:hypothetical protein
MVIVVTDTDMFMVRVVVIFIVVMDMPTAGVEVFGIVMEV